MWLIARMRTKQGAGYKLGTESGMESGIRNGNVTIFIAPWPGHGISTALSVIMKR